MGFIDQDGKWARYILPVIYALLSQSSANAPDKNTQLITSQTSGEFATCVALADTGSFVIGRALGAAFSREILGNGNSFFEGTKYTSKVIAQMKKGDFHAFPESVKAFETDGYITTIKGGDGVTRQLLKIPGEYSGKKGIFEFIKETNGDINHRMFRPSTGE